MRKVYFRAKFRKISNGEECWQLSCLTRGKIIDPTALLNFGYIQVTDWEQFTCLHDKNGKEIYEGDILEFTEYYVGDFKYSSGRGVVKFDNGSFYLEDSSLTPALCEEEIENERMKVIGNIHENPEFLKMDKE